MRFSIAILAILSLQWLWPQNSAEAFGGFATKAGRGVLWTWVGGPSTPSTGNYGTKGVPSTSNIPPKRGYGCAAKAPNGSVYLFGGEEGGSDWYTDLWGFNPSTMEWTWLAGPSGTVTSNTSGTYGTKGTPNAANNPGVRKFAACWADSSSNFWLFGGQTGGSNNKNDLWKYDVSTGLWTWISGSSTNNPAAVFGTKGVEDSGNIPSGRERMAFWKGSSDEFWFFGGADRNSGSSLRRNDLWRYRVSTGHWTWMSGTSATSDAGTYGTKGTPSTSNVPSSRHGTFGAVDPSGNFWLFGGVHASTIRLSDLWKYNPTSNEWTWMAGPSTTDVAGVYGTRLVHNAANNPNAKGQGVAFAGPRGDIHVLFGGDSAGTMNDVMSFNPVSLMWTWLSGSSSFGAAGVYGTINVASWSNIPGSRAGAMTWTDADGTIWVFGGNDFTNYHNDLWKGQVY